MDSALCHHGFCCTVQGKLFQYSDTAPAGGDDKVRPQSPGEPSRRGSVLKRARRKTEAVLAFAPTARVDLEEAQATGITDDDTRSVSQCDLGQVCLSISIHGLRTGTRGLWTARRSYLVRAFTEWPGLVPQLSDGAGESDLDDDADEGEETGDEEEGKEKASEEQEPSTEDSCGPNMKGVVSCAKGSTLKEMYNFGKEAILEDPFISKSQFIIPNPPLATQVNLYSLNASFLSRHLPISPRQSLFAHHVYADLFRFMLATLSTSSSAPTRPKSLAVWQI